MKYLLMMACLFIMVWKSLQLSVERGTYKKLYGSKNPKKMLNVVYEMCMTSTPAYISATARPVDSSLPHTFKVTVVDIQRYSVLVELERTDQKSGWDEIWLAVDWVASSKVIFRNCNEYYHGGYTSNGTYEVLLPNGKALNVSCYMEPGSGGWTFVQRRKNGSVDFYQDWANYTKGFGNLDGDFWLGLENLHLLTKDNKSAARIVITMNCYADFWIFTEYIQYSFFQISSAAEGYKLNVGGYNGSLLGDYLSASNGYSFSTYDKLGDQIRNLSCSERTKASGWWRHRCHDTSINGIYSPCSYGTAFAGGAVPHGWYGAEYTALIIQHRN
uniref:ficolin-1-A-like n=1 Tax=Ciona intestinalis TaxID=7719 RepID=UPI0005214852|nr:ficolin-1-A-like [Ciona intestinalis]|eukprot:XP_009859829.1 ficolin-1-A-like [Ciona intestinalis]